MSLPLPYWIDLDEHARMGAVYLREDRLMP